MIEKRFNTGNPEDEFYFIEYYKEYVYPYIAAGKPSKDTLAAYHSAIDQFLEYCNKRRLLPLRVKEYDILKYREYLYDRAYQDTTVALKLAALRKFYHVAKKFEFVKNNPLQDIKGSLSQADIITKYLTKETLQTVISSLLTHQELRNIRNTAIFVLMALEGLRTVEIHRMNEEDIDFINGIIYIRGKGHSDMIYPREDTMYILGQYIQRKTQSVVPNRPERVGRPVVVSLSNHNNFNRISRDGIRRSIDAILKEFGLKKHGISCHVLRHTCATLLYEQTKDLQVVKETLRHKSVQMSSKYAHVQDRMTKRYTNAIPIKIKEFGD